MVKFVPFMKIVPLQVCIETSMLGLTKFDELSDSMNCRLGHEPSQ